MQITLAISANQVCDDLILEVWLDKTKLFESTAKIQQQVITAELSEDPNNHVLELIMRGKLPCHTVCDQQNNIKSDVYFEINKLEFDDMDVHDIFCQGYECYSHNFNSPGTDILDEFYGIIGCNGVVKLNFTTPIYLWAMQYFD